MTATWFIDPLEQLGRSTYSYNAINDYRLLARWCRARPGRVIVCEGRGASWLPFRRLCRQHVGTGRSYDEIVWTRG